VNAKLKPYTQQNYISGTEVKWRLSGKQKSGEQDKIRLLLKEILKDVLKTKENGHRWDLKIAAEIVERTRAGNDERRLLEIYYWGQPLD